MKNRLLFLFAALLICALGFWRVFLYVPPWSADMFVRQVRLAMMRDPQQGWATARQAMRVHPNDPNVLTLAAEAAAHAEHVTDMIDIVTRNEDRLLISDVPPGSTTINVLIDNGYHRAAQGLLDYRLRKDPDDSFAVRTRSDLLLRHGRHFQATDDLRHLLSLGAINLDELVFLSSRREFLEDRSGLKKAAAVDPEFVPITVGLGALAATEGNLQDAKTQLQKATSSNQAPAEAWAALGLVYYRLGLISNELQTWRDNVRSRELNHPDIHFVTGWMASQEGAYQDSVHDLCRALQLAPLHRPACQLMSGLLVQHGTAGEEAEFFSERAAAIHELEELAHSVLFGDRSFTKMEKLAQLCEQLGETRLAEAWWKAADLFRPDSGQYSAARPEAQQRSSFKRSIAVADRLKRLLSRGITDEFRVVNGMNRLSSLKGTRSGTDSIVELQFHDVAASVGITEDYFGAVPNPDAGLWIYQGFGGGVAVIDFDGDDAPDFCFTQANDWPSGNELPFNHQDLLYRNRQGVFDQVNHLAFSSERGFGQGIAVGDADRDGFPDLYVANIGPNRLLMNNGDGTFRSVDLAVTYESQPGWTTSCLLTDLDADGFDDLYDVQYVEGTDPFKRICHGGPEGAVRGCLPSLFNPAHDEFLHNQGDGRFAVQTRISGLTELKGRGLGVLAADLDGDPGLEVFVSNDMTSNHFLKIQPTETGVRFADYANSLGLARNGEGQVEACMGIAAADISGDGALDLFVTNFFEETNTYYESQPGGFFRDQTRIAQLGAVSLKQLGFGSQVLDADLDRDWDLLVANGHVDDYRHSGIPWKMTCDLMQNTGASGFVHCRADNLGGYGEIGVLGRAMARVDWNRDGLPDAIITHLDRPPALLENRTHTRHHSLSLRLTGTALNRSAVGAVLTISLGDQDLVFQCVAGDGYYCSNDRTLLFGTGQLAVVPRIVIRWPSGGVQEFLDVPADCRIRVIEGHDVLYTICP
ncbi:MAG: hypothetical protein GY758_29155 [Fuerstiella sp.]|nr:hypothetical protein [Fuerstiella sp.]